MRKIVQLHYVPDRWFVALCDDGSLWMFSLILKTWERLADIPQGDAP